MTLELWKRPEGPEEEWTAEQLREGILFYGALSDQFADEWADRMRDMKRMGRTVSERQRQVVLDVIVQLENIVRVGEKNPTDFYLYKCCQPGQFRGSLRRRLLDKGELTEKQREAVRRMLENQEQRAQSRGQFWGNYNGRG